ncbi:hypothetical protein AB751O23_CI_00050 [Chlamydiales bacterium SCGC AB-751-O23]|nr:hypothetical protein AB751O23_CI_00050 [Chlamydiales bacterium SCGC AB-751-O23]
MSDLIPASTIRRSNSSSNLQLQGPVLPQTGLSVDGNFMTVNMEEYKRMQTAYQGAMVDLAAGSTDTVVSKLTVELQEALPDVQVFLM